MATSVDDVETLAVLWEELYKIYETVEQEPEESDSWKRLTTDFDDGITAISRVLSALQIRVQRGDIK